MVTLKSLTDSSLSVHIKRSKDSSAVICLGVAFKRYALLRTLLSTEFAIPLVEEESLLKSEWEETLEFLSKRNYVNILNDTHVQAQDLKVFSLLHNVLLPFIDAIYVTCLALFEVK